MKKKTSFWKTLLTLLAAAAGLFLLRLLLLCLLVCGLFLALFTACSDHPLPHSRREVQAYLREEYPGEEITAAKRWTPHINRYNNEDGRVWDCYYKDLPEVPFQVMSFRRTGGPVVLYGYDITDNYMRTFLEYYLTQYQKTVGSLDVQSQAYYQLDADFSGLAEARTVAEQMEAFCIWFGAQPHAPPLPSLKCSLENMLLPVQVLEDSFAYIDLKSNPNAEESILTECTRLLKDFYAFYNIQSPEFPSETLTAYAAARWKDVQGTLYQSNGEVLPASVLDGIPLTPDAGTQLPYLLISYGGLYELLCRLGLEPEGVPEYYTVTGADGHVYEFSYAPASVESGLCWPLRRDGEPLECPHRDTVDCAPVLQLRGELFQAVTGLTSEKGLQKSPEDEPPGILFTFPVFFPYRSKRTGTRAVRSC